MSHRIMVFLFASFALTVGACQPSNPVTGSSSSPSPAPTAMPRASASASPTATPASTPAPAAVPSPSARPLQGAHLSFRERTIDWDTLGASEKARFIVQDFDGRKLVAQFDPKELARGGEFEFHWDAPPPEIPLDPGIDLGFNAKINLVPSDGVGSAIGLATFPAAFFELRPENNATQNVGRMSDGSLAQGSLQYHLRPVGLNNPGWTESTDVVIAYQITLGPTIAYHYRLVR